MVIKNLSLRKSAFNTRRSAAKNLISQREVKIIPEVGEAETKKLVEEAVEVIAVEDVVATESSTHICKRQTKEKKEEFPDHLTIVAREMPRPEVAPEDAVLRLVEVATKTTFRSVLRSMEMV